MWGVRSICHCGTRIGNDYLGMMVDCLGSNGAFRVLLGDLFRTLG